MPCFAPEGRCGCWSKKHKIVTRPSRRSCTAPPCLKKSGGIGTGSTWRSRGGSKRCWRTEAIRAAPTTRRRAAGSGRKKQLQTNRTLIQMVVMLARRALQAPRTLHQARRHPLQMGVERSMVGHSARHPFLSRSFPHAELISPCCTQRVDGSWEEQLSFQTIHTLAVVTKMAVAVRETALTRAKRWRCQQYLRTGVFSAALLPHPCNG